MNRLIPLLLAAILLPEMAPVPNTLFLADAYPITHRRADLIHIQENYSATPAVAVAAVAATPENGVIDCKMCTYIATRLNTTIFHNPTILSIVTTDIEKICDFLPSSIRNDCINAAVNVAPIVLQQVGVFVADEGCIELGICPGAVHDNAAATAAIAAIAAADERHA
jgi:hypothetical protein